MAQRTLDNRVISIRAPWNSLTPNEKRIYRYLKFFKKGRTEKRIHEIFPNIGTIGNRLRSMREKGWVKSKRHRWGDQVWVVVPK